MAAFLCVVGTVGLGVALGFGLHAPWNLVLQERAYPYLSAYAVIAVQLLLAVLVPNQAFALIVGVMGALASFAASVLPQWLPWVYPALAAPGHHGQLGYVLYGLACGMVLLALGSALFNRKEAS